MTAPGRQTLASAAARLEADVSRILQASANPAHTATSDAPVLILTIGLPGSGKSTFARRLAPQLDAVILESDALRRLLFDSPAYSRPETQRLFVALHGAARQLLRARRNVIIDATSITDGDRRPAFHVAEQAGARLLLLNFTAPEDVIKHRLAQRLESADPQEASSAGLRVYRRMAARAQAPSSEHWNVDTSNAAEVESALSRVVEACRPSGGRAMGGIR
ncbi:MAG TPA: ATP-binding protein [Dehalococcoidia bacterium]|nr:ATP-binding protein [Dehalococcoidia bacterium]